MRAAAIFVLVAVLTVFAAPERTTAAPTESEVKSAYLFKLASFVRWPDSPKAGGEFRICVFGRRDIAGTLERIARNQTILGSPVTVAAIANGENASHCQLLFLGAGPETARRMADATDGSPVLTVGDVQGGTGFGVIDFTLRDGRVRLRVDERRARARGLSLSSKLLGVAVEVER